MTLYYSLVSGLENEGFLVSCANTSTLTGLHSPGIRDGAIHEPDSAHAVHLEAKAFLFPIGKSDSSEDAILVEGETSSVER